jgi:ubiquinone/menaquinone biosynthesis C-methylase UbiE/uncharacterized protein YbaR (Trm112 family)
MLVSRYVCPQCRGILQTSASSYECLACGRLFPVYDSLPDLMVGASERECKFYEQVSFDHHYRFLDTEGCYFRDDDHFADQVGHLIRLRELRAFLASINGHEEKELIILDAGCGDGVMTQFLLWKSNEVYCVDLSLNSLKKARRFLSLPNMGRAKSLDFARCNIHALPFSDAFFDVVIATEVLEHTSNPGLVMAEFHRTLKLGGRLYISTPNADGRGFVYGPMKNLTRRVGFRLKERREFYGRIEESEREYNIKGHLREFTVSELTTLLLRAGFSNLRSCTRYCSFLDLQMVSKLFRGMDRIFCAPLLTRMYAALEHSISLTQVLRNRGFIHICCAERLK